MEANLYMVGYFDNVSGYGQLNQRLAEELLRRGTQLQIFATSVVEEDGGTINPALRSLIHNKKQAGKPEFLIYPCYYKLKPDRERAWLTFFESSELKKEWVQGLERASVVIVTNDWNYETLKSTGISTDVVKVPLFVDHESYSYAPPKKTSEFTVGCSGSLCTQRHRKNLPFAIEAFRTAFPKQKDVRLKIKIRQRDHLEVPDDPRITLQNIDFTTPQMRNWYISLDVFFNASKAEGWGFQPLEAMAIGRPVIGIKFGGVAEYFNEDVGYVINHTEEPCEGFNKNLGNWGVPNFDHTVELLRYAYKNREALQEKGKEASTHSAKFSLKTTVDLLSSHLEEHNIFN